MRGLYYLTSQNYVNHLDIIGKLKTKERGDGSRGSDLDIENRKDMLVFTMRESVKDDSYLLSR